MSGIPNADTLTRQPGRVSGQATTIELPDGDDNQQITPEQAVEEAKRAREKAEQERDAARVSEQRAAQERDEARQRANEAGGQVFSAEERAVEQSIAAQTSLADQAKNAIAIAQAAGDHVAVADAFDKLAEAKANIRALADRKAWLGTQKPRATDGQTQQQQQRSDAVSVTTPQGTMIVAPAAKQWMDDHPRFYNDTTYFNHAVAAHGTITADGVRDGTPAYFRALDDAMRRFEKFEAFERGDHNGGDQLQGQNPPRQGQRRAPASSMGAPVSRGTSAPYNPNGQVDPLTVARRLGGAVTVDDLREFARINGYGRDEAGFQKYLKDQDEIYQIDRAGGDTGMRVDGVYR